MKTGKWYLGSHGLFLNELWKDCFSTEVLLSLSVILKLPFGVTSPKRATLLSHLCEVRSRSGQAGVAHGFIPSRGRRVSGSSRPVWSSEWIPPGQPELHREALSQTPRRGGKKSEVRSALTLVSVVTQCDHWRQLPHSPRILVHLGILPLLSRS